MVLRWYLPKLLLVHTKILSSYGTHQVTIFVWNYYPDTSQIGSLTPLSIWCIKPCIHLCTSPTWVQMLQVGTDPRELPE